MCLGVHLPLLGSSRSHSYFDFEQDARAFMSSTCTFFIVRSGHQISNQGLGRPQHWPTDWSTEYRPVQLACKQEKASPRLADCAIKPPKSRTQSALVKFYCPLDPTPQCWCHYQPPQTCALAAGHAGFTALEAADRPSPSRRPRHFGRRWSLPCQGEPHSHSSLCPISGDPGCALG